MAHSYNVDSFRCGCEFCAPVPAADRKFEPAQDPRLWHRPVANGRHPLVLDRCFTFEKQNAFICRHVHAPWINCYSFKPPEGYDSDADDPDDKDNPVMSLSDFSSGTRRAPCCILRGGCSVWGLHFTVLHAPHRATPVV